MIASRDRLALVLALTMMAVISVCNTVFPLVHGWMLDAIQSAAGNEDGSVAVIYCVAVFYLLLISGVCLVREIIQVVRTYVVERTCTQIEKSMTVDVFSHILKIDMRR